MVDEKIYGFGIEHLCSDKYIRENIGQDVMVNYVDPLNQVQVIEGTVVDYSALKILLVKSSEDNQMYNVPLIGPDSAIREILLKDSREVLYFNEKIKPFYNPFNLSKVEGEKVIPDISLDIGMMMRYNDFLKNQIFRN